MSPGDIERLVGDYGYGVILLGTYFDHFGVPLFLVFGGIAASTGILDVYGVMLCGLAGGWIGDLVLYFLGYKTGLGYWMQFAWVRRMEPVLKAADRLFRSRPVAVIILGRFLFAVSKIIPPFAGMIRYRAPKYLLYSLMGNILYASAYTALSYTAGPWVLAGLDEWKLSHLLLTFLFLLILVWAVRRTAAR
ncbi:MAG: DedA family protein [Nitrospinaceae bacterium]